ncbi:MAG: lysophospholipase [Candidatus Obscuribacterales bacterium]|nr:lysophospholipase [Candidatus Obscuribacterales bacterium]
MAPVAARILLTTLFALSTALSAACLAQDSQPASESKEAATRQTDADSSKGSSQPEGESGAASNETSDETAAKPQQVLKEKAPDNSAKTKGKSKPIRRGTPPCLSWVDSEQPVRAVLLCVHGLGLHNGTYDAFGKRLSKLGYAVYAIDVRGFGSWMAAQGREKVDFDGCMEDVRSTLKVVHRAHPGLPVFILGESMGGAIALRACAQFPELVDGLISSVPAGDRFKQGQTKLTVAFHLIADPNTPFDIGTSVIKQATVKPELRDSWGNNPLSRLKVSANELIQFQNFMNQNHKFAVLIKDRPVLFVQGCDDKLVRPEGTVELYNRLATKDRQIELIPKAEHLIFEEAQFTDREVEIVNRWLTSHLGSTKGASQSSGGSDEQSNAGGDKKIGAN